MKMHLRSAHHCFPLLSPCADRLTVSRTLKSVSVTVVELTVTSHLRPVYVVIVKFWDMSALTGINSIVTSLRAFGMRFRVVHRRQMWVPPAQTVRQVFEGATIANSHMASAAKCDHSAPTQLRERADPCFDSHSNIVGNVITRHRQ